jgi:hypothetical protein
MLAADGSSGAKEEERRVAVLNGVGSALPFRDDDLSVALREGLGCCESVLFYCCYTRGRAMGAG